MERRIKRELWEWGEQAADTTGSWAANLQFIRSRFTQCIQLCPQLVRVQWCWPSTDPQTPLPVAPAACHLCRLHARCLICFRFHNIHFWNILSPPMLLLLSPNLALIEILPGWHLVPISSLLNLIWAAPCIETCLQYTDACMQIHLHKQLFWHLAHISVEPLLTLASSRSPSCIPVPSPGRCTPSYAYICNT